MAAVTPRFADVRLIRRGRVIVATDEMRRVREACGLNRMELGRMIGVRVGTIIAWERDKRVPHADYAIKIAEVIDELERIAAEDPSKKEYAST
jgi:DNA-binding XRE family transcriptional regulator